MMCSSYTFNQYILDIYVNICLIPQHICTYKFSLGTYIFVWVSTLTIRPVIQPDLNHASLISLQPMGSGGGSV